MDPTMHRPTLDLTSDQDVLEHLRLHQAKELLRFTAVGSVDDGKSTLIGRLLHDTSQVYEDQLSAVRKATTKRGDVELDYSLFTDGLKAEREQGITIDVAYRYFTTEKRKFIIADTPGHVQYTRNMATGASTANLAIVLIDARLGVLPQSRRHAFIASLLGIPHLAVCINKMDLVDFDQAVFEAIRKEFSSFVTELGFRDTVFIPVSAKHGDNVVNPSTRAAWYSGPTLLTHLESVVIAHDIDHSSLRLPVQYVLRPNLDYRGFAGTLSSGTIKPGDEITVLPSGKTSRVTHVDAFEGPLEQATAPMSITVRIADEVDISRGDMLVHSHDRPRVTRQFDAMLVWMSAKPLDPGRGYLLKHTTQTVRAEVASVTHLIDLETLARVPAERFELNDIGRVSLKTRKPLFVDPYTTNRGTGAFILIEALSNDTVAAGMIVDTSDTAPGATDDASEQESWVTSAERRARLKQSGAVVWLEGKADARRFLAKTLERAAFDEQRLAVVLDSSDQAAQSGSAETLSKRWPEQVRRLVGAGFITIVNAVDRDLEGPLRAEHGNLVFAAAATGEPEWTARRVLDRIAAAKLFDDLTD